MAVTIYFKGLWQDFVQFLYQIKNNSTDRIKEMVTKFLEKPKSQNTAFEYLLYNLAISHVILSQIFDTARNAYCILSNQYTDNSSCFLLWYSESWYRPRRDRKLRFKKKRKKEAVCRILRFWLIMKI